MTQLDVTANGGEIPSVKRILLPLLFLLGLSCLSLFITNFGPEVKVEGINPGDVAWLLTSSALVLLMTPGLSFFYGGMVSKRNIISTMLQSFVCMGVISLLWIVVGFSLSFGKSMGGFIGNPLTYFMFKGVGAAADPAFAPTIPLLLFAMFQLKFAVITPALITGSFAERVRFSSYLIFICLFSLFVYAPLAHWTWHPEGFLHKWGVLDFAGGTVVHMSAGFSALAGALFIGRRKSHTHQAPGGPANIPYVLLGTGLLWFGWFGFNAGSALTASPLAVLAFATTNTASASAMLAWIFLDMALGKKPSALGACIGAVVGLVAVTPAAGYVSIPHSLFIGALASVISNLAVSWKSQSALDDTLDVFPCHGVGGMVGLLATGLLAKDVGLIYGQTRTFLMHVLALVVVAAFSFFMSYLLYWITDLIVPLRVSSEQEKVGLDMSQHAESIFDGGEQLQWDAT